jgi:hypothetical protein
MSWTLTIHEVPPSGNVIKRLHWARYSKLLERWWWLVRTARGMEDVPTASGKRKLTITRHGVRPLDRDNLYASMKPVIDVLRPPKHEDGYYKTGKKAGQYWSRKRIGHGLIREDDAANLELVVLQEPLPRGQVPHLELHFENIPMP